MKIVTWNVNSIRARIDNIKEYLKSSSPDIAMLQEIKTEEHSYPFDDLNKLGYISYVNGQKSYNGVSILSKKKLDKVNKILPGDKVKQSRLISAKIKIKNKNIDIINIYVPNGNPVDTDKYTYKLNWIDLFIKTIDPKTELILISGEKDEYVALAKHYARVAKEQGLNVKMHVVKGGHQKETLLKHGKEIVKEALK